MEKGSKNESKINKKELIITIIVLLVAIVVGIIGGRILYDVMYGRF